MKKYIVLFLLAVITVSCEDFLDTTDLIRKNSENFPQTQEELNNALTGVYGILTSAPAQDDSPLFCSTILGDEAFGNGGAGDLGWQSMNRLLKSNENGHANSWGVFYTGIYRCNSILQAVALKPDIEFSSDEARNQLLGEVYAMRAYYYFNLACMFGHYVPLRLEPIVENKSAATAEELYAQIGDDLSKALSLLSHKSIQELGALNVGHMTRWAAETLAAKVFMFYTGYYKKTELPTLASPIMKKQVIEWLEDCMANSGHSLLTDYRNNYVYGNQYTAQDYKYAKENGLSWIGDTGDNTEAVFVVKYSKFATNRWGLLFGIRNQSKEATYPFRDGWGAASVNPKFFEQWLADEPNDIRRNACILDVSDPSENLVNYQWNVDQGEETGYYIKKAQNVNLHDASGKIVNFSYVAYGGGDGQGDCCIDQILFRYSDVLLMHSELTGDASGINRVRARVGLSPIVYSQEALQRERCYELAFDGCRYYDLLRWYGTDAGVVIDKNQNGATYYRTGNVKKMETDMTSRVRDTGGFLEIPKSEIDLAEGVLEQNPGWVGSGTFYLP